MAVRKEEGRWLRRTISAAEAGCTVEEVLTGPMGISRRMIQRLTRSKGILLNRRPAFLGRHVRTGDLLAVRIAAPEALTLDPTPMSISVLYEDSDVLVVDKAPGVLVHPTAPHHHATLAHGLAHYFAARGLEIRIRPVHRLDRDTSGAIVFAKSGYAHQHLDRQLREGALTREYLALVEEEVEGDEGRVDAPIGRAQNRPMLRAVSDRGQPAMTTFEVEARFPGATLLRVVLHTGRTHQIRVHMAHLGHPLAGDRVYGARVVRFPRYALHSARLEFVQPRTGEWITVTAPIPPDLAELLERSRQ